jgi:integrase
MALTEMAVKSAKPRERTYRLTDGGGMFLEIKPSGSKYWRMHYRHEGKQKTLAFGVYPEVGLATARERRNDARKLLRDGIDPNQKDAIQPLAETASFEAITREWLDKRANILSKRHIDYLTRQLERNIFPDLGHMPMAEIKPLDLLKTLQKIEKREAFDLAHRMRQISGQIFRYGIITQQCENDIAASLKGALTPYEKGNFASISPKELRPLCEAISRYDDIGDMVTKLALQFIALTFQRPDEVASAPWTEIDQKSAIWELPKERTKKRRDHLVPLSSQALRVLKHLAPITGRDKYLFTGRNGMVPISENTILFALYRLGYKSKMTAHGFRHLASTILNETFPDAHDAIERQLSHVDGSTRGIYNKALYLSRRKELMQWWGDHLEANGLFGK